MLVSDDYSAGDILSLLDEFERGCNKRKRWGLKYTDEYINMPICISIVRHPLLYQRRLEAVLCLLKVESE